MQALSIKAIKLEREASIDAEIVEARSTTNDWFGSIPERPERISVRIYSVKTVYSRVLAKVKEQRRVNNDENQDKGNEPSAPVPDTKKK